MAFMLDGAKPSGSRKRGTQIANVNQDMTSEVKVLMSSYDAEYAKGPVVFQAFGKSGGKDFHVKDTATSATGSWIRSTPPTRPWDPPARTAGRTLLLHGGNVGGPVLMPFWHFNRNRNKLFFWFGYEYMNQVPVGATFRYFVPDSAMLGGNFSPSELAQFAGSNWSAATSQLCPSSENWTATCSPTELSSAGPG